jgi:hypothetical protein
MTKYGPTTKWAVERRYSGDPDNVVLLGTVRWMVNGYRFFPNTSSRKPSRKSHPTFESCLPRWVGYPDRCETRAL